MALVNVRSPEELSYSGFFKAPGGTGRYLDWGSDTSFPDAHSVLSGMEVNTLPINTDKYAVMWHWRKKLGAAVTSAGYGSGTGSPTHITIERYIPIGRQLAYSGLTGNTCEQKMYLLVWCSTWTETIADNTANGIYKQFQIVTYFRDPKA